VNLNIPAIGDLTDVKNVRLVLYQSGRLVHAPLLSVFNLLFDEIEGVGILLSGDEQTVGSDRIELSGDESGYLLLS
jgi:hypothetical protein